MDSEAREPALLRRIEELAARAAEDEQPPEGPVLAAALTGLRAELGGLRAELGTLRADVTAVRSGVDASTGRLAGVVSSARTETEQLARRHEELAAKVVDLTEVVADVRDVLPGLRTALGEQPSSAAAVQAALSRLDDDTATRIETLANDLRRTLSAGLTQASAGSRAAETAWGEARSALEERLAAVEDTLDGLAERLEALTRDSIGSATDRIERVEAKLDELADRFFTDAVEAQAGWAESVRAALVDVAAAVDRSLGSLGDSLTGAVQASREAERGHIDAAVAELSEALRDAVGDLEDRIAVGRDSAAATAADLRGFLEGFQSGTEQRLEEVRSSLATGLASAREGLVGELQETLDRLVAANSDTRRLVEDEVGSLRGDLADALEEVRDRITTTVSRAQDAIGSSVEEQRSSFDDAVRSLRADVLDRVEESTAAVQSAMDDLRAGVSTAARTGEQTSARVDDFADTLSSLESVVSQMNADWDRRSSAAIDHATAAGEAAVAEFRTEIGGLLGALRTSVDASVARTAESGQLVNAATTRLVAAGQALLGYLARRDRELERERDRVLHEVLDEFAQGLSAKERRTVSDRVGSALERRRDARDAERYRRSRAGEPPLDVPDVPADLAALVEEVQPEPSAPAPRPSAPSPARDEAPAKKTAKTTAKKTAKKAANPAAKKSTKKAAKKSPAKSPEQAAKKASATPTDAPVDKAPAAAKKATAPAAATRPPRKAAKAAKVATWSKKTADAAPEPTSPSAGEQVNTTEPLDAEGTTRV